MWSKYAIEEIQQLTKSKFNEGVYIVLLNVLEVPPHLLVMVSGKVFSIGVKGVELDKSADLYWQYIHKNKVPCVFVELALPEMFTIATLQEKIRVVTAGFPKVNSDTVTCLLPIKTFCSEVYATDAHQVHIIFDLLEALKKQNSIAAYYHLNLIDEIKDGVFEMHKYTLFEVKEAIYKVYH